MRFNSRSFGRAIYKLFVFIYALHISLLCHYSVKSTILTKRTDIETCVNDMNLKILLGRKTLLFADFK